MKFFLILFLFITQTSCNNFVSGNIDKEQNFNHKAITNLYLLEEKNIILKKFIEYANHEHIARQEVKKKCLNFVNQNKLKHVSCKFMGTKFTERLSTSLN